MTLQVTHSGLLYFTTENTGGSLDLTVPEGVAEVRRHNTDGVLWMGPPQMSIQKDDLPAVARFFAAAAFMCGVDINAGWDAVSPPFPMGPEGITRS